ncbi:hypothetical protein PRIPAC_78806 [Pristionchus pacificus]|uniref:Uncharacterized protein n=1 Tax=Pristionchus pacificus TaxID=54126 RepID=A0A2A6BHL3_PRIPA|nr:hypothetical protein PRIPAC_78806 [Pristionchus pacificus]|eukprot:PDM65367.1 hypothetical protein PRIPAC_52309 [Pristionchus pacificus]
MHKMKRRGTLDACEFQRSLSVDSAESSPHRLACKKWRRRANNSMQSFFNNIDSVPGARFTKDDLPRSLLDTIQTRRTSFYVTVTHGVTILILGGTTLVATIVFILLLVDLMRT